MNGRELGSGKGGIVKTPREQNENVSCRYYRCKMLGERGSGSLRERGEPEPEREGEREGGWIAIGPRRRSRPKLFACPPPPAHARRTRESLRVADTDNVARSECGRCGRGGARRTRETRTVRAAAAGRPLQPLRTAAAADGRGCARRMRERRRAADEGEAARVGRWRGCVCQTRERRRA